MKKYNAKIILKYFIYLRNEYKFWKFYIYFNIYNINFHTINLAALLRIGIKSTLNLSYIPTRFYRIVKFLRVSPAARILTAGA